MSPERVDATTTAPAQGPRLLGVPMPLRAFGLAAGWQISSGVSAGASGMARRSGASDHERRTAGGPLELSDEVVQADSGAETIERALRTCTAGARSEHVRPRRTGVHATEPRPAEPQVAAA